MFTLTPWQLHKPDCPGVKLTSCSVSVQTPYKELQQHCNLWRNWVDIQSSWQSLSTIVQFWALASQKSKGFTEIAHPGSWNDPDMLIIGNEVWQDAACVSCVSDDAFPASLIPPPAHLAKALADGHTQKTRSQLQADPYPCVRCQHPATSGYHRCASWAPNGRMGGLRSAPHHGQRCQEPDCLTAQHPA